MDETKKFDKLVGEQIKGWRTMENLTQKQLGFAIGLSREQICNIETGRSPVSLQIALLMATVFTCSPMAFLPSVTKYKPRVKIPQKSITGARKPRRKQAELPLNTE